MRLGVDLGGTFIKSGLVDESGKVLFEESCETFAEKGAQAVLQRLAEACKRQLGRRAVTSIGIGTPGRIDTERGVLLLATNLPLVNVPIAQILQEKLGLPVYLDNDANCALYGELHAGEGRGCPDLLYVTVGTGIGGAIYVGGRVYRGVEGRGGEFGHMSISYDGRPCRCGRIGCWEQYASAAALCRMAQEAAHMQPGSLLADMIRGHGGQADGRLIFSAARFGCPVSEAVLDEYARYLAVGLNNLFVIFRPERIVLAGGIFSQEDLLLPRIKAHCWDPDRLAVSSLQGRSGIIGASLLEDIYGKGKNISRPSV